MVERPLTANQAHQLSTRELVDIINNFTFKIHRQEEGAPICGFNLFMCLLGAAYGFEGKAREEFLKMLGADSVDVRSAMRATKQLRAHLKMDGNFKDATSAWHRPNLSLDQEFARFQEEEYGMKFGLIDADAISTFIHDSTSGLISLTPDISSDMTLLLVSCLYFKGNWKSPFNASLTSPSTFETWDEGPAPCAMMENTSTYQYQDTWYYQALLLPYRQPNPASPEWSAIFVLPKKPLWGQYSKSTLLNVISTVTADKRKWAHFTQSFVPKEVTAYIPRFELHSSKDLLPGLRSLGLKYATQPSSEHWATSPRTGVSVNSVSHMTYLKCGERGTVMVSSTMCSAADSMPKLEFLANRPFWFIIFDRANGLVLYSGIVDNVLSPDSMLDEEDDFSEMLKH